jgi:hypothetical protein
LVLILKRLACYRERKTFTCFLFEKGKTVLPLGNREVLSDPNVVRNNKTKRRWASVFGNIGKSFCWPNSIWFFCGKIIHKAGTESGGFNSLSAQGVATKYKDFTSDHAMALLSMREDIGRGNVNEVSQCFVYIT